MKIRISATFDLAKSEERDLFKKVVDLLHPVSAVINPEKTDSEELEESDEPEPYGKSPIQQVVENLQESEEDVLAEVDKYLHKRQLKTRILASKAVVIIRKHGVIITGKLHEEIEKELGRDIEKRNFINFTQILKELPFLERDIVRTRSGFGKTTEWSIKKVRDPNEVPTEGSIHDMIKKGQVPNVISEIVHKEPGPPPKANSTLYKVGDKVIKHNRPKFGRKKPDDRFRVSPEELRESQDRDDINADDFGD